jgi:hypothetical protein
VRRCAIASSFLMSTVGTTGGSSDACKSVSLLIDTVSAARNFQSNVGLKSVELDIGERWKIHGGFLYDNGSGTSARSSHQTSFIFPQVLQQPHRHLSRLPFASSTTAGPALNK